MEELSSQIVSFLVPIVELCGALVVMLGVVRTMALYVYRILARRSDIPFTRLRETLGRSMVMGLEFQVAADILKTGLSPTWNELLLLAGLIAVRTLLNFLLEHEMRHAHEYRPDDEPTPGEVAF